MRSITVPLSVDYRRDYERMTVMTLKKITK